MELRDYLRVLRKGWPLILAFVVVGSALGIGLTLATTKVYQASVQVFVASSGSDNSSALAQGNTFIEQRVQSYTNIANGPAVTSAVIDQLGLKSKSNSLGVALTRQELAGKITSDAPQNKVLINLHVTDTNPRSAAVLANSVAKQFDAIVQNTEQADAQGQPVVKLTVIHPATVPTAPIKPSKTTNIGLGFFLGLLVGIGIVVLRDVLDNTVKGPEDFEALGVPVLSMVPFDKRTPKIPIAFRDDPHGARSEAYRQLRTNLQFVNVDNAPRVIAVTSAVPGEGKSTTSLNLAAALAEGGYRVCLIEADLRRPTIAKVLGLVSDVGFTTALIGKVNALDVLQNAGRNLAVLTCGPVPPNPSELLITSQARTIIREIAATVDYTIIDTAPLLPVADGAEVAAMADATLVVHHAGKSTKDQAARSVEALAKVGEKPVGVILNRLVRNSGSDYAYGYYYTYRPDKVRRATAQTTAAGATAGGSTAERGPQHSSSNGGSSEPVSEVSYAVADLPPLREASGPGGFGLEAPDFGPAPQPTTAFVGESRPDATADHAVIESNPANGHSTNGHHRDTDHNQPDHHQPDRHPSEPSYGEANYGDAANSLFDGSGLEPEQGRAERWRELRGRKSRR